MTFLPLGNSDHVVVSVSIDFPLNSQQNVPFHHITDEYSQADRDSLHDHLGNVKLIFALHKVEKKKMWKAVYFCKK